MHIQKECENNFDLFPWRNRFTGKGIKFLFLLAQNAKMHQSATDCKLVESKQALGHTMYAVAQIVPILG